MAITPLPAAPSRAVPSTFSTLADAFLAALSTFVTEANALETNVNAKEVIVTAQASAAATAMASANFKGLWSALSGALAVPASVSHLGRYWMLITATANITEDVPGTSAKWQEVGNVPLTDFNAAVNLRAMSQGVAMTAAGSGSSGIAVADNDNLNMGTGNFAPYFCGIIPDVTPTTDIILAQKHDATNGWILTLLTTGYLRTTINAATYDSTATLASIGVVDGENVKILSGITRETDSVAGSVQHYVNGSALGTSVAITAGAPTTVTNAVSLYVLGTSAVRTAGVANTFALFNRCPTAAEVLDLYRNGIAESDKWGSQTNLYTANWTSTRDSWYDYNSGFTTQFTGNNDGISDGITSKDDCLKYVHTSNSNPTFTRDTYLSSLSYNRVRFWYYFPTTSMVNPALWNYVRITSTSPGAAPGTHVALVKDTWTYVDIDMLATASRLYISAVNATNSPASGAAVLANQPIYLQGLSVTKLGATLALEPEGIQPAPGQWLDSSSNKLHALQPATGSSLTRYKNNGELRWTNTWDGTHEAQYVGGINQAVFPSTKIRIDSVSYDADAGLNGVNIDMGDGSAGQKYVAAMAMATGFNDVSTFASRCHDGTNLKFTVDPASNVTGSLRIVIKYTIME